MRKIYIELRVDDSNFNTDQKESLNQKMSDFVSAMDELSLPCEVGDVELITDSNANRQIGIDGKDQRKKIFDDV